MLLNCGVGEDSWESPGLQGDPTSQSQRKSVLNIHWKDWCWSWNSNTLATCWKNWLLKKEPGSSQCTSPKHPVSWPRGMVWGGRREEGSGWGTRVYLWWIHVDIWQNQYNTLKLKNKIKLKKKKKKKNEPDTGKEWRQKETGTTEDEMVGWLHWLNGHESKWTPGVGDGQGGLVCCGSWGHRVRHDWVTEMNWTELSYQYPQNMQNPLAFWLQRAILQSEYILWHCMYFAPWPGEI